MRCSVTGLYEQIVKTHSSKSYHSYFSCLLKILTYLFDKLGLSSGTQNLSASLWLSGSFSCSMWTLSCGMWDLVPCPGTEPGFPALAVWSINHWTTWQVPDFTSWYEEQYVSIGRDRVTISHLGNHLLQPSPHPSYHNSCAFDGIGLKSRIS